MTDQEWEHILQIKTAGRDDSRSDTEHHPYEPTDYPVLERLANTGLITKRNTLLDYGSGKGRVAIFMTYQTGCRSMGIEYDERLHERAVLNGESRAARNKVTFIQGNAETYEVPTDVDCCFFFNPFALHTMKRVMANILDSHYKRPRVMRLFFYYVNEEMQNYLNNHIMLELDTTIDCGDLFEDDAKEQILVYEVRGY